jgi:hypothetical protein
MDHVNQRQDQLDVKGKAIMLLLDQNASKLSPSDRQDIRALARIAREFPEYDVANRVLGYAHSMAMTQASPQARQEVMGILDRYGRGGYGFPDEERGQE